MRSSVGIDYQSYATGALAFDYERLLADTGYDIQQVRTIQQQTAVGATPLVELHNITALARQCAAAGKGARIFVKDEAANPSGSFKDRRASLSIHEAKRRGYAGVVAATSGNYGAAVASQAAKAGLKCIIVQEAFDSHGVAQPEIAEKTRACEAYGAEGIRLSVGPELFYVFLKVLDETGFFNASLYTPYSILGIETLGYELAQQTRAQAGRQPDVVIATHAGGGNVTGTARGLRKAGADQTQLIAASVDLSGLHMASDHDFNRKSFTTGHTGFAMPFTSWPDRADVPRNAARPLRYMDRFVTASQGEVFYITQALAVLEGMERGPAGNTSLAAAFAIAQKLERKQVVVVQETEYTGAGKHPLAQLNLALRMGVEVRRGDPGDDKPGERNIPWHYNNVAGVNTARQTLMGLDGMDEQVELKPDGLLREQVRELKERAVLFLEEILELGGYYAAVEAGEFVDQGYFPERRGDGISRDPNGGDRAGSVVPRNADYGAPVCSHFGNNAYAEDSCREYGGCNLCNPDRIQYIDDLDPGDNVHQRLKEPLAERARGIVRPEVEKHGDGIVCVTLFIPASPQVAEQAALEMARHMGLENPQVINRRVMHPAEGSLFEIKGVLDVPIRIDLLPQAKAAQLVPEDEIEAWVRPRGIHIVAATVGEDEHSVGLHEILDIKHGGTEKYGFLCHDLGTSVSIERLLDAAVQHQAAAVLISTIVTHQNVHRAHMRRLDELARERGLRERLVLVAGGAQVDDELAKECGMDAGFGRGTRGREVGSYLVEALRRKADNP